MAAAAHVIVPAATTTFAALPLPVSVGVPPPIIVVHVEYSFLRPFAGPENNARERF